MRKRIWIMALLVLAAGWGIAQARAVKKIPVIYDSDIGDDIDDTWALGLLLKSPEYDIRLVVGDQGKSRYRAKLFARMLERAGRTDIPVGIGLNVNMSGDGAQAAWVKDYKLEDYPGKIYRDGVQAIIDTIMGSPEKITLICVGPLPNIAEALRREPRIAEHARFVGMHGSVRLGYGGSKKIAAEYNVKADVKACQKVFTAGWDMTITPLDTCGLFYVKGEDYQRMLASDDPVARAVLENYRIWSASHKQPRDVVGKHSSTLFDTVAVYLGMKTDFINLERLGIRVTDKGYTKIDPAAKKIMVATSWKDMGAFEDFLVRRLTMPLAGKNTRFRRLPVKQYIDRMKAGWIGQMAGVGWGGPTEFRHQGTIIPMQEMPVWKPEMINQFNQDDIYVEMTFLRTLELYGLDVSIRQAGIDFANSQYPLWHANRAGRDNLRSGIAPPDSGHPQFNKHADDIDYQIESDYAGLIAPGMPNVAIQLGETFGRLMNYGDGLYGGQFVGGMYAAAFFESDVQKIIEAGLQCIPKKSQYYECIMDVLNGYKQYPHDWTKTWELIEEKYYKNPAYRKFSCSGPQGKFDIDAKLNGAYIAIGLLYGGGDLDKTIIIATRCGQDSDCNPSSAGGVIFTTVGYSRLPAKFTSALDPTGKFSHTPYNFPRLIAVCKKLVRQAVLSCGGRIETDSNGEEVFVIPALSPRPSLFRQCWEPGPIANSRFTEAEKARIVTNRGKDMTEAIRQFSPGWKVKHCGFDMEPGFYTEKRGRKNVLLTHPLNRTTGCVIMRKIALPERGKSTLKLVVGNDPRGDWDLIVKANGKTLVKQLISNETTKDGWIELDVDITPYNGKAVKLELINQPNGWSYEAGLWASIRVLNKSR